MASIPAVGVTVSSDCPAAARRLTNRVFAAPGFIGRPLRRRALAIDCRHAIYHSAQVRYLSPEQGLKSSINARTLNLSAPIRDGALKRRSLRCALWLPLVIFPFQRG